LPAGHSDGEPVVPAGVDETGVVGDHHVGVEENRGGEMDSVGRAQQRRCDTAGETDDVCGDWSFGHTGECAFDGVVDLVFVVGTGGKSGCAGLG
jgi:hypothetical protein